MVNAKVISNSAIGSPDSANKPKKFFSRFFGQNVAYPIILFTVIAGAFVITYNSNNICVIQEPSSGSGSETKTILRDNPICSRYFEMTALIIGGILGLTVPGKGTDAKDIPPPAPPTS